MEHLTTTLRVNHILKGTAYTYHIENVLGQGSFGITYLASTSISVPGPLGNIETKIQVAIKEFFMKEFSSRHEDGTITEMTGGSLVQNYSKKFRKEAENLAKLSHPNIVNVLEVFDANNTCYYAMQYIPGGSLDEYVKKCGGLPEKEAIECIRQIGAAVQYMHDHKMLHLDLKPSNVMRSEDGKKMVLIDFGLSKQYEADGVPESSTTIGLGTPGYAPLEQSSADREKDFAPTLDVYALGATFFKLLTGQTPPKASDVLNEGFPFEILHQKGVSRQSINAIESAMEPRKPKRLPDVNSFLSLLSASIDGGDDETDIANREPEPEPKPVSRPEPEPKLDNTPRPSFPLWLKWMLASAAAVILIVIGIRSFIDSKPVNPDDQIIPADSVSVVDVPTVAIPETKPSTPSVPSVIPLKSISLNKTTLTLEEGQSAVLSVKFTPNDATDRTTTWKSSDPKVVTVSSKGKVSAVKSGSAAVIASCGGFDSYCNVTVTSKPEPVKPQQTAAQTGSQTSSPSSSTSQPTSRPTTGAIGGHEYVDLGLPSGLLWATCNVGASSPSDYGGYYAWGETMTKSSYYWSNLKYRTSGDSSDNLKFSKYVASSKYGPVDNKTRLDLSDDAARANWGGSWRMPTVDEWKELKNNCTWTWTSQGGHNGYKVTGKNGNSIFLSAAGYRRGESLRNAGEEGAYFSSSLYTDRSYIAFDCYFDSGNVYPSYWGGRYYGHSVRPVCSSL